MASKPKSMTLVQPDLFGAAPVTVAVVDAAPRARRRRTVHETQRAAHRGILTKAPTVDERCRLDIAGNGQAGRTRQEIADRTGIKLQTVCGCVDRLRRQGKVCEPVIGYDDRRRPIHYQRGGSKVVVVALYQDTVDWLHFGQLLQRERTPAA